MNIKRSFSFDDETFKKLDIISRFYGVSRSELVRNCINAQFKQLILFAPFVKFLSWVKEEGDKK